MKINANTIESFIKNVPPKLNFFLIYGPEHGKIQIIIHKLIKYFETNCEVNVAKYDFKDIKNNSNILKENCNSQSLFEEKNIIVIENCNMNLSKEYLEFLQNYSNDAPIIFVGGELKPTSNLRKFCENSVKAVSIACYKDDVFQLQIYIKQLFVEQNITFDRDVPALLSEILPPNYLLIANELEKLILYKIHVGNITCEDVNLVINEGADIGLDEICLGYITNNQKLIQQNLNKLMMENTNWMLLIRVFQRFLNRLTEIFVFVEEGFSIEQACSKIMPPVFFKQKDNLIKAAKSTTKEKIYDTFEKILKIEKSCKSGIFTPELLLNNFLSLQNA